MLRYVAFVVLGCAFLTLLWMTVHTHRLYAELPLVVATTGTLP